jgi:hypothetical protein
MKDHGSNSDSKKARGLVAVLAMLGIVSLVWFSHQVSNHPSWFVVVLLGLASINLGNWVLEFQASPPQARCRKCGAMRAVSSASVCGCGTRELRIPWLNRVALALTVAFLAVIGISSLWVAVTESSNESRAKGFGVGVVMTALAVAAAAEIKGYHVTRWLRRSLGDTFPYEFEGDIRRLKLERHLAIRIILLVLSMGVLTASVTWLIRHP